MRIMEPATSIIRRCGGVAVVASWLGINRTTVLHWGTARSKGGTGGTIPAKHQRALLHKALDHGIELRAADLFAVEKVAA